MKAGILTCFRSDFFQEHFETQEFETMWEPAAQTLYRYIHDPREVVADLDVIEELFHKCFAPLTVSRKGETLKAFALREDGEPHIQMLHLKLDWMETAVKHASSVAVELSVIDALVVKALYLAAVQVAANGYKGSKRKSATRFEQDLFEIWTAFKETTARFRVELFGVEPNILRRCRYVCEELNHQAMIPSRDLSDILNAKEISPRRIFSAIDSLIADGFIEKANAPELIDVSEVDLRLIDGATLIFSFTFPSVSGKGKHSHVDSIPLNKSDQRYQQLMDGHKTLKCIWDELKPAGVDEAKKQIDVLLVGFVITDKGEHRLYWPKAYRLP